MKKALILLSLMVLISGQAWSAKSMKKKAALESQAASVGNVDKEPEPAGATLAVERKIVSSIPLNTYLLRFSKIYLGELSCSTILGQSSGAARFDNTIDVGSAGLVIDTATDMMAGRWIDLSRGVATNYLPHKINAIRQSVSALWLCTIVMEETAKAIRIGSRGDSVSFASSGELERVVESAEGGVVDSVKAIDARMMPAEGPKVVDPQLKRWLAENDPFEYMFKDNIWVELQVSLGKLRPPIPPRSVHTIDAVLYDKGYSKFMYRLANGDILTVNPDSSVSVHRNGYLSYDSETLNGARITVNTDTSGRVTVVGF